MYQISRQASRPFMLMAFAFGTVVLLAVLAVWVRAPNARLIADQETRHQSPSIEKALAAIPLAASSGQTSVRNPVRMPAPPISQPIAPSTAPPPAKVLPQTPRQTPQQTTHQATAVPVRANAGVVSVKASLPAQPAPVAQKPSVAQKRVEPTVAAPVAVVPVAPAPAPLPVAAPLPDGPIEAASGKALGIIKIEPRLVTLKSGGVIRPGEVFPSGERLLDADPVSGRIVTDKRVIVVF